MCTSDCRTAVGGSMNVSDFLVKTKANLSKAQKRHNPSHAPKNGTPGQIDEIDWYKVGLIRWELDRRVG